VPGEQVDSLVGERGEHEQPPGRLSHGASRLIRLIRLIRLVGVVWLIRLSRAGSARPHPAIPAHHPSGRTHAQARPHLAQQSRT